MTTTLASAVTEIPAAPAADAYAHFSAKLAFETDCADVAADLKAGTMPYTVVDVRTPKAYAFGHVPGAINVPVPTIDADVAAALPEGLLVVYCWGPGCNGADKAAARLASHGRQVKEMLGGFEYWAREGQPIEGRRAEALAQEATPTLVG